MSTRELVVLGTSSQVPTRTRNHNGYLLRWDGEGILFDPGEGTQRQMTYAGVAAADITRLCITHFHGDHCLGVPGVIQRLGLDGVSRAIDAHFPASGEQFFDRLRHASEFFDTTDVRARPIVADGDIAIGPFGTLSARRLDHSVQTYGYRLVEPDGRRMLPDRLAAHRIVGVDIGRLQRHGSIEVNGRTVALDEVSAARRGQRFAFVMDTVLCDAVYALADGVDMLVIEATYLDGDAELARAYRHLTAGQAARVAMTMGARQLVLTHFSRRYTDSEVFRAEAAQHFDGDIAVAEDLSRIAVPRRR